MAVNANITCMRPIEPGVHTITIKVARDGGSNTRSLYGRYVVIAQ
jgi:hypothetical protein